MFLSVEISLHRKAETWNMSFTTHTNGYPFACNIYARIAGGLVLNSCNVHRMHTIDSIWWFAAFCMYLRVLCTRNRSAGRPLVIHNRHERTPWTATKVQKWTFQISPYTRQHAIKCNQMPLAWMEYAMRMYACRSPCHQCTCTWTYFIPFTIVRTTCTDAHRHALYSGMVIRIYFINENACKYWTDLSKFAMHFIERK